MATFPELEPATRTYIPGTNASTQFGVLNGNNSSVRHSNAAVGHVLRLSFERLTSTERFNLIAHYAIHGTFETFDLPDSVLIATNLEFPANYLWRYQEPPQIEQSNSETIARVTLELLPPYLI